MIIYLYISSKSLKPLNRFVSIITSINTTSELKIKVFGVTKKAKRKKVTSVLKSPHVNKTAQEQFESITYSRRLLVSSYNYLLLLLLVKQISNKVLPELNVKIKLKVQNNFLMKISKTSVNPINQKLSNNVDSIESYLKVFDIYGELLIRQMLKK